MNISSLNSSWAALLANRYSVGTKGIMETESSSKASKNNLSGVVATNSDGDTFQLSSEARVTRVSEAEMFSKMDTDGDGSLSAEDFIAARPSDVTAEMAANLYSSLDTDSSGSLTASEYTTSLNDLSPPLPPPPSAGVGSSGSSDGSNAFDALDTNQDGVVSAEEFAAAKPDDVTEEMAANLFNHLDKDGSGSLTAAEYAVAMGKRQGVAKI
jgi:Ca2+-binding EF-hand superfamily protein